jgi:GH15 family glucan-1,4-alpha-glucosidase
MAMIEDYGLIGDLHTAALIDRTGSIDWLCLPRFDSSACLAGLLGGPEAGHFSLAPADGRSCTRRRYDGDTLVLITEWEDADGHVRLIDFMAPSDPSSEGHVPTLFRILEGVRGRMAMRLDLRLRMDYGHVTPWVEYHKCESGSLLRAVAGPDAVWLSAPVRLHGDHAHTWAAFDVTAGDRKPFVLGRTASWEPAPHLPNADHALQATRQFWRRWLSRFDYAAPGHRRWAEAVRRSVILLKALTYAPTGGIVAAATTSLPEQVGGERNWDYRYCWLRDATFTLQALLGTGFVDEAKAWREWLLRAVAGDPSKLQIMYGVDGQRRLPESTIDWLPGYEKSTPVRVGNAASQQFQLDVWGELLDGLHLARRAGLAANDAAWDVQRSLLDFLESHWQQPDNGLWEIRGEPRHFVHSKVMAWAGMDRAVQAVERFGLDGPVDRWRATRDEIHEEVCRNGYDADRNTFTQSYGSTGLDAALLLIPQVGFLPPDDPRVIGTVEAVQRELDHHGFVLRYQPDRDVDGLAGQEGSFLACTFWLADALAAIGRHDEAVELFDRLLDLRNDLGLLSEEYDANAGRQLGNIPQAYSLVGLVNTARRLSGSHPADLSSERTGRPAGQDRATPTR